ncbi:MaoC family dehydratase [Sneathiella marina]|uniref:MaoC family dehydratase n=1 Tax=Sneathiella marina TaxID=2950108 RepID=A0ABY4WAH1_9PROT|nr:MaoC family dehydratase [Sneathiella marina]USG61661.1 MaoC family dehydratase [Sneathiella marina]
MMTKTNPGNFFEDFAIGQVLDHATPRTVTEGDASLYTALYGSRFALQSADSFAMDCGLEAAPIDNMLVFHIVFGKTVPDVSLNAVANLGYADVQFRAPVYPGDSLQTSSEVIGLKENSNGKTGVVYVRSVGKNQMDEVVLDYVRWVMVRKKDETAAAPSPVVPQLTDRVDPADFTISPDLNFSAYNATLAGSPHFFEDYEVGEKIDHVDGMTIEEAEHMMATRLYQNTAKVHFNQHQMQNDRFGRRLIYGGHIISLARALTFNGLGNAQLIAAINGGSHTAPTFAGHTIYAWSEVLEKVDLPGRSDAGALRIRTLAAKDLPCDSFPDKSEDGKRDPAVVLDLDYWVIIPKIQQVS